MDTNNTQKPFVHLHVHTQYSMLDGAAKTDGLFELCDKLGQPAVAITDHGGMFGVLDFVKKAAFYSVPKEERDEFNFYDFMAKRRPFKVKPIVGCEVYVAEDMSIKVSDGGKMPKFNHLVLLCKNETGYKNLIKIVSMGYIKGLYYKPRIDLKLLEQHSEGLVCLSACLAGAIPQAIMSGDLKKADELAKYFKNLFGDDFYIEIQDHNIKRQKQVLPHLISIARQNNIKLVATNDVHYLTRGDATMQKVLQCISFRTTLDETEIIEGNDDNDDNKSSFSADSGIDNEDGYFPTKEFYLKSRTQMEKLFPSLEDALNNTIEIADKCDCYFFRKEQLLPIYTPSDGSTPYEFLQRLTYEGLEKKYKVVTDEIKKRADYELNVINSMGFVEYFLIVWDFIHYAETKGIPVGPGRGSGVGSIVAYSVGITKVDPLKYELIFERFLNPERVSSPDFDIDFCVDRRDEVIAYVVEKYGIDNVSQIVTFGTLAAKAAVKDVGRVFNYPYADVERITKLIPSLMGKKHLGDLIGLGKDKDAFIPDLLEMYESDAMVKRIFDMAMKIEGMPRQTGMHAAGVIICKNPIFDHIPMAKTSDDYITTEFNMIECEELGLLKMDFLGLRTLTDIKKALDIVKKTQNKEIDFYNMDYDDKGVFELIGEGDTHAVFQLESEGMKRFMRDLKPTSLEDIIAGISLYRPGPMDKIGDYVSSKRYPERIKYDHDLMKDILSVTYGIMVYQEQVMKAVQVLAGYTLGRADELRRIMSKKKHDKMEKERKVFLHGINQNGTVIPGAVKNGVSEAVANKIFDDMTSFASYAFNKSHAAAYAFLAYQTAYLKRYYTVEFIAAVLNNRITSIDEIRNYLTYLKEKNIQVLPPDINRSSGEFTVEDGSVRIGLAAIKNVGGAMINEIILEREQNGDYTDFVDFIMRMKVTLNKRLIESLIYAGAFDRFGKYRSQLIQIYDTVLAKAAKERERKNSNQFSFFDDAALAPASEIDYPKTEEFSHSDKLRYEREVAGVYLSGHPLDEYADFMKNFSLNSAHFVVKNHDETDEEQHTEAGVVSDGMNVNLGGMLTEAFKRYTKAGKELGIGKLEDLRGTVEVLCAGHILTKFKDVWQPDKVVQISGKVKEREGLFNIWIDDIKEIKTGKSTVVKQRKICVYLQFSQVEENIVDTLAEMFRFYPGDDTVYIKDVENDRLFTLGTTGVSQMLLNELYGIVGENNIKVI